MVDRFRRCPPITLSLFALFLLIMVAGAVRAVRRTDLPVRLALRPEGLRIERITEPGALPASWPDPMSPLLVRSIDGLPITRSWHVRVALTGHRRGDPVELRLETPGGGLPAGQSLQKVRLVSGFEPGAVLVVDLVGLCLLMLAGFILLRRERNRAALPLAGAFVCIAIFMALDEPGAPLGGGVGEWILAVVWSVASGLTAPLLVSYSVLLFEGWRRQRGLHMFRDITWAVGSAAAVVMVTGVLLYLGGGRSSGFRLAIGAQYTFWVLLTWGLAWLGAGIHHAYRTSPDPQVHRRYLWMILGYLVSVVPILIVFLLPRLLAFNAPFRDSAAFPFLFIIPVSVLIAIVRYRLLDVTVTLKQGVMYGPLTALVYVLFGGAFIILGYLLVGTILPELPRIQWRLVAVLGLLAVCYHLLFEPLWYRVQRIVDRAFYRTKYSYGQRVRDFAEGLDERLTGAAVIDFLHEQIRQSIEPSWIKTVDTTGRWAGPWPSVQRPDRDEEPCLRVPFKELDGLEMWLGSKRSGMAYHRYDRALTSALAAMASNMLHREILQRRLLVEAAERELLRKELEMARSIQEGLLPKASPQIEGYEVWGINIPCLDIGGDYFDYIPLSGGRWLIAIGDVVGHGIPAALLMANLHASLRSHTQYARDLPETISRVNDAIWESTDITHYITLFCGILDPATGSFTYVNAGHPFPIQIAGPPGSSGQPIKLTAGGIPLGMMPGASYSSGTTMLPNDSLVFLYTDGVTEAQDEGETMLGEEDLLRILREVGQASAEQIVDRIRTVVLDHIRNVPQDDDITMVALRRFR
jgi:serine phosphatase RsbU (regulator of sigma subunit)